MWQVRERLAPMVRGVCAAMHIPWSESEEEGHYLPSPPLSLEICASVYAACVSTVAAGGLEVGLVPCSSRSGQRPSRP